MKYRRLGKSGPQVSAVSQGRGAQPVRFGESLEAEFNATIHRALDLGINFFDSSDAYWGTRHEVLLGRALKGRRNEALVTSNFGNIDLSDGRKGTNGHPDYVFECCNASMKRLGVDVIDIYYLHRVDPEVPIEDTVGAMAQLISQGKVRFIGLCEAGVKTLKRAHREHPITVLQTEYSLWFRAVERDILPIPGTNHVAKVEQNAAAAELELAKDDLKRLSEIFAHGAGAGERYQAHVLKGVGL